MGFNDSVFGGFGSEKFGEKNIEVELIVHSNHPSEPGKLEISIGIDKIRPDLQSKIETDFQGNLANMGASIEKRGTNDYKATFQSTDALRHFLNGTLAECSLTADLSEEGSHLSRREIIDTAGSFFSKFKRGK